MNNLVDRYVTVEFEPDVFRNLLVPVDYATIEDAITAAGPGGTNIVLAPGTYTVKDPNGIDFMGKGIVLMSTDPTNPAVMAKTIIDCAGTVATPRRAFHFHSGEGAGTVVNGVTIRNGLVRGPLGLPGVFAAVTPNPYEAVNTVLWPDQRPRAERGHDASGDSFGGAILCENGSSPTFRNCVITNCVATGAHGGDGAAGQSTTPSPPNPAQWGFRPPTVPTTTAVTNIGDAQWGGIGGAGSGIGHGGALACLNGSSPTLTNCTFQANAAYGGFGGAGGTGGNSGSGLSSWGGNGGDATGDGRGGAIYCDGQSQPVIQACHFVNNLARSGVPGVGGAVGAGAVLPTTAPGPAGPGSPGNIVSFGQIGGGAIYYGPQMVAKVTDCDFTGNQAYQGFGAIDTHGLPAEVHIDAQGGAVYAQAGDTITLANCQFTRNIGGAVYVEGQCAVDCNECRFLGNSVIDRSLTDYVGYFGQHDFVPCSSTACRLSSRSISRAAPFTSLRAAPASR